MMERLFLVLASLFGAVGVGFAALAGHDKALAGLRPASDVLLFHAPALIGLTLALKTKLLGRRTGTTTLITLAIGVLAFSADIAARAFLGYRLIPMLAPAGGTLMIVGWLGAGLSTLTVIIPSKNHS